MRIFLRSFCVNVEWILARAFTLDIIKVKEKWGTFCIYPSVFLNSNWHSNYSRNPLMPATQRILPTKFPNWLKKNERGSFYMQVFKKQFLGHYWGIKILLQTRMKRNIKYSTLYNMKYSNNAFGFLLLLSIITECSSWNFGCFPKIRKKYSIKRSIVLPSERKFI